MLKNAIQYVRRQPKNVRDRYSFAVATVFTGIIVMIWAISLPGRFASPESFATDTDTSSSPFSTLFDQAGKQLGAVRDAFSDFATSTATGTATTEVSVGTSTSIVLSEAELRELRARPTTTPSVVVIATSSSAVGATSTSSSRQPAHTNNFPPNVVVIPSSTSTVSSSSGSGQPDANVLY